MIHSATSSAHRIGPVTEPANTQSVQQSWLRIFLLLHCGLMVPYITHLVPTLYGLGIFPIRPAFFMLALCFANAFWLLLKGPDFTKTAFLLFLLIGFRVFDIAILQRFTFPDGQKEPFLSTTAILLMAIIIAGSLGVIRKTNTYPIVLVAGSSIVIEAASVLMEFAGLYRLSTVAGRAAGLAGDSNDSCMMMSLMLGVFLTLNQRFWVNMLMIGVTAMGILPTLSRGGMLSLSLIVLVFCLFNLRQHAGKLLLTAATILPLLAIMVSILLSNTNSGGVVDQNAKKRIEGIFGGDIDEMKSGERLKDLNDGIEGALLQPLTGLGTGAGQVTYQPHNQLVTLMIDLGLFGPTTFLLILGVASLKVLSAKGKGLYILIPLFLYIGLAQTLLENYAYIYALLVLLFFTSNRFFTFRLARPSPPI